MKFNIVEAPEELLRVATDGKIHSAGRTFVNWTEYMQYVVRLEAVVELAKDGHYCQMLEHGQPCDICNALAAVEDTND